MGPDKKKQMEEEGWHVYWMIEDKRKRENIWFDFVDFYLWLKQKGLYFVVHKILTKLDLIVKCSIACITYIFIPQVSYSSSVNVMHVNRSYDLWILDPIIL